MRFLFLEHQMLTVTDLLQKKLSKQATNTKIYHPINVSCQTGELVMHMNKQNTLITFVSLVRERERVRKSGLEGRKERKTGRKEWKKREREKETESSVLHCSQSLKYRFFSFCLVRK